MKTPSPVQEFGMAYYRQQIKRQRNPLRKLVKSFYVARVLRHVDGPAIDMGCGAGQILERLPGGSLGIEINPYLIEDLTQRGCRVLPGAADSAGGFNLSAVPAEQFRTLVLSHVLEHFNEADQVLRRLLQDCASLGISTVIVVVPGRTGYRSDPTHKTFVDMDYLRSRDLLDCAGFQIAHHSYFPGNLRLIEEFFIYHELMVVYRMAERRL